MPVSLSNDVLLEIFEWFVLVDDDGPFKVISLSKAWRSTALRCSRFWSRIVIDQSHKGWQQRVQKAVTLSQDRPLHLKIICRGLQIPHDLSQFQSSFSRIQTITSHASTKEQLKWVLHYLFANRVMSNIDKVEQRSSTDDPVGAVAIIYNVGIVNWLEAQEWLKTNDPEPLMTMSHPFIRDGMLPTTARSVFEVFIDEGSQAGYYCNWAAKGVLCKRWFKRRSHAIGHARIHLNYRPFACNGKCGSENW
ncbi:hypothetical protein FRC20_002263 [Serendipita sp. 405]|nr:hypothetical protein FRC20_002263 [Serendipita sp. 405]